MPLPPNIAAFYRTLPPPMKRVFFKRDADKYGDEFVCECVLPALSEIVSAEVYQFFAEFDSPPGAAYWLIQGAVDGSNDLVLLKVFLREFILARLEDAQSASSVERAKELALLFLVKVDKRFFLREPTVSEFKEMINTYEAVPMPLSEEDWAFVNAFVGAV